MQAYSMLPNALSPVKSAVEKKKQIANNQDKNLQTVL